MWCLRNRHRSHWTSSTNVYVRSMVSMPSASNWSAAMSTSPKPIGIGDFAGAIASTRTKATFDLFSQPKRLIGGVALDDAVVLKICPADPEYHQGRGQKPLR